MVYNKNDDDDNDGFVIAAFFTEIYSDQRVRLCRSVYGRGADPRVQSQSRARWVVQ